MQYLKSSQPLDREERPYREPTTVEETRGYLLYLQQYEPFRLTGWIRENLLMFNKAPAKRMEEALQKPDKVTGNEGLALEQRLKRIRDIVETIQRGIKKIDDGETSRAEVFLLPVTHRRCL